MKTLRLLLVLLFASYLFSGCAGHPGSGSLWAGMSKAQALRAMGPPESVSSQGGFEYLNYTIAAGGGYIARPYYVRLHDDVVESFGYQGQFQPGSTGPVAATGPVAVTLPTASRPVSSVVPAPKVDQIRILDVTPQEVALGRPNHLKVKVSYLLQSQSQGTIDVAGNTKTPNMHLQLGRHDIPSGSGEFEFELDITPVAWQGRSSLELLVSLFPRLIAGGGPTSSLDYARWDMPVRN